MVSKDITIWAFLSTTGMRMKGRVSRKYLFPGIRVISNYLQPPDAESESEDEDEEEMDENKQGSEKLVSNNNLVF